MRINTIIRPIYYYNSIAGNLRKKSATRTNVINELKVVESVTKQGLNQCIFDSEPGKFGICFKVEF